MAITLTALWLRTKKRSVFGCLLGVFTGGTTYRIYCHIGSACSSHQDDSVIYHCSNNSCLCLKTCGIGKSLNVYYSCFWCKVTVPLHTGKIKSDILFCTISNEADSKVVKDYVHLEVVCMQCLSPILTNVFSMYRIFLCSHRVFLHS